ncbi:hypothetical protein COJ87_19930 [Bacillus cereus]|nr:hypothetical protein CON02_20225 [Bacillus cereus]PFO03466.1 hypothetical protein COJ68_01605 [Bacillus cereus]PFO75291.1 hypothetical protein COJ87_19930 [Bacillus cereus]PGN75026.1 hypothetical protein CN963_28275 [Bacillus cereus]
MFIFLLIHLLSMFALRPLKILYPKVAPILSEYFELGQFEVDMFYFGLTALYYYSVYQLISNFFGH